MEQEVVMMRDIYNFSADPAVLPEPVIRRAGKAGQPFPDECDIPRKNK